MLERPWTNAFVCHNARWPSARLRLHKIESQVFQPLEWVPLLDMPSGRGLVLLVALAASSSSYQFWEGCVHMYSPYKQPFPGTLLSTGMEDYFDSAFGFDTGRFHGPVSGCTHRKGGMPPNLAHSGDPDCFTSGSGNGGQRLPLPRGRSSRVQRR